MRIKEDLCEKVRIVPGRLLKGLEIQDEEKVNV